MENTVRKNDIIELEVTDVNNFGNGIARKDGMVIFVQRAVTGDRVRAKIIKVGRDYAVARIEELLLPSEHRKEPACPYSKRCGGCSFDHIEYNYELTLKRSFVESAFRRAGISSLPPIDMISGCELHYRNKVQYPVCADGELGFYAKRSHEIIPSQSCLLQDERFEPILKEIKKFIKEEKISIYDENTKKGWLRHVYLRIGAASNEIMVALVAKSAHFPKKAVFTEKMSALDGVVSVVLCVNGADSNVILGKEAITLWGKDKITDILCSLRFEISPLSFYQVNRSVAERLYERAAEYAEPKDNDRVLDLFCGAGTIGCSVAARFKNISLSGVEIIPDAVENARANAEANGIKNAHFICTDAKNVSVEDTDILILDPPRAGCSPELIAKICASSLSRLVYISCNPDTLARDVALLADAGFSLCKISAADMFPRTGHVETVILLSRKDVHERIKFDVNVEELNRISQSK